MLTVCFSGQTILFRSYGPYGGSEVLGVLAKATLVLSCTSVQHIDSSASRNQDINNLLIVCHLLIRSPIVNIYSYTYISNTRWICSIISLISADYQRDCHPCLFDVTYFLSEHRLLFTAQVPHIPVLDLTDLCVPLLSDVCFHTETHGCFLEMTVLHLNSCMLFPNTKWCVFSIWLRRNTNDWWSRYENSCSVRFFCLFASALWEIFPGRTQWELAPAPRDLSWISWWANDWMEIMFSPSSNGYFQVQDMSLDVTFKLCCDRRIVAHYLSPEASIWGVNSFSSPNKYLSFPDTLLNTSGPK